MQVAVFEVCNNEQSTKLNEFLAGDGRLIVVDKIFTAAAATHYTAYHYITVVYSTLEQAPNDLSV